MKKAITILFISLLSCISIHTPFARTIKGKGFDKDSIPYSKDEQRGITTRDLLMKYKWVLITDSKGEYYYREFTHNSALSYYVMDGAFELEEVYPYDFCDSYSYERVLNLKKERYEFKAYKMKQKEYSCLELKTNKNIIRNLGITKINDSIMILTRWVRIKGKVKEYYKPMPKDEPLKIADILKKHQWVRQIPDSIYGNLYEIRSFSDKISYTYINDGEKETQKSRPYYISDKPDKIFRRHRKKSGFIYIIEKGSQPCKVTINDSCLRLHNVIDKTDYIYKAMPK